MKKIILLVLLGLGLSFNVQAQDRAEEAANYAADYICNCVNKVYAGVDAEIRVILVTMYAVPEAEQTEYIQGLSEELQVRIVEQSLLMASEEKAQEFEACNTQMVEEISSKYADIDDTAITEEELMNMMLDRLNKKKKCAFTYLLMKIGTEQQKNNTEEIIEDDNSDGGEEGQ